MSALKAVVVGADMLTPFGMGIDPCWDGLLAGRTTLAPVTRFGTQSFFSNLGGVVPGLQYHGENSLAMQLIARLFSGSSIPFPPDAKLLLATIKGEIDLLEQQIISGNDAGSESSLQNFLSKVIACAGTSAGGMVVSAACTSASAAAARAAAMIRNGQTDCVLVVACDSVTEFVYSGFSSLMALDKVPARPFDQDRAGLSIGEAAAWMLIMSEERAVREQRVIIGEIAGWGMSDDANHMTGPSRESEGLIRAINAALCTAGITADQVDFISAHGTGTVYNDAMELGAFHAVFAGRQLPVYSIKGAIGHTMGAAGLVEMIIAQRAQRECTVPPTVNLQTADEKAIGWVANRQQTVRANPIALVTNAGFSGINTALVLA